MDFDDASVYSSNASGQRLGGGGGGRQRFIVIHSDGSSDISRLSFPSEYSLSATSRSRSSHASSNVSSRLWDFSSPRESEWDVTGVSRPDLRPGRDYSLLSPAMPRKSSVVTFDISEPTVRRHSSPAPSLRRKDSVADVAGTGTCSSSSSLSTTAATGGMKASDSGDPLTENAPPRDHQVLEKRISSSRHRRSEQSSLLSVVDEVCSGTPRPMLPKSASYVKPTSGTSMLANVDRPRSSVDSGARATGRAALMRHSTGANLIDAPAGLFSNLISPFPSSVLSRTVIHASPSSVCDGVL